MESNISDHVYTQNKSNSTVEKDFTESGCSSNDQVQEYRVELQPPADMEMSGISNEVVMASSFDEHDEEEDEVLDISDTEKPLSPVAEETNSSCDDADLSCEDIFLGKMQDSNHHRGPIAVAYLTDKVKRNKTFSMRQSTLLKWGHDLHIITGAKVCIIIQSESKNIFKYDSTNKKKLQRSMNRCTKKVSYYVSNPPIPYHSKFKDKTHSDDDDYMSSSPAGNLSGYTHHRGPIMIKYITATKRRQKTFSKRKATVLKWGHDLHILTGAMVRIRIESESGNTFKYDSTKTNKWRRSIKPKPQQKNATTKEASKVSATQTPSSISNSSKPREDIKKSKEEKRIMLRQCDADDCQSLVQIYCSKHMTNKRIQDNGLTFFCPNHTT